MINNKTDHLFWIEGRRLQKLLEISGQEYYAAFHILFLSKNNGFLGEWLIRWLC